MTALARKRNIEEKKMFGGVGFLLHGNMLVGVWKDSLIVRLGPDSYDDALLEPHVREFDITGRPMKGWVLVVSVSCSNNVLSVKAPRIGDGKMRFDVSSDPRTSGGPTCDYSRYSAFLPSRCSLPGAVAWGRVEFIR